MSNTPNGFSQSANHASNVNLVGAYGDNNRQKVKTQVTAKSEEGEPTKAQVIDYLAELEKMVYMWAIPDDIKENAIASLTAAKKAAEREEPKKESAAINLTDMAETLKNAGNTVDAGKSLWEKTEPILVEVAQWLGPAAASLRLLLPQ